MLLVNKADLLSRRQRYYINKENTDILTENRTEWSKYFKSQNLSYVFFSAHYEQIKQENPEAVLKQGSDEEIRIYSAAELIKLFTDIVPAPIGM